MTEEAIRGLGTGELIRRLIDNLSSLVDREVELARSEARADLKQMITGSVALVLGLLLLYSFVASLIVAGVLAVAGGTLTPVGVSLVVAGVFLALGVVATLIGWMAVRVQPLKRTRETVMEDIQWSRARMR